MKKDTQDQEPSCTQDEPLNARKEKGSGSISTGSDSAENLLEPPSEVEEKALQEFQPPPCPIPKEGEKSLATVGSPRSSNPLSKVGKEQPYTKEECTAVFKILEDHYQKEFASDPDTLEL